MTNIDFGEPDTEFDPEEDWYNSTPGNFDFGRVLSRSFSGLFANLKHIFTALVIALMATVLMTVFAREELLKTLGDGSEADLALAAYEADYWLWRVASFLPAILFALWFQLMVVQTTYAEFTKTPLRTWPMITALRALLPMLVVAFLYLSIGTVGFVFAWAGWAVAGPILVHEKKGIFESMGAAWKLSDGYKLWVFLLLIVIGLIGGGIYYAAEFILSNFEVLGDDTSANAVSLSMAQKMLNGVIIGLPSFFVLGFFAAGMTAAYVELKTLKGHLALAQDVFD